jgi:hypothetical protein
MTLKARALEWTRKPWFEVDELPPQRESVRQYIEIHGLYIETHRVSVLPKSNSVQPPELCRNELISKPAP